MKRYIDLFRYRCSLLNNMCFHNRLEDFSPIQVKQQKDVIIKVKAPSQQIFNTYFIAKALWLDTLRYENVNLKKMI